MPLNELESTSEMSLSSAMISTSVDVTIVSTGVSMGLESTLGCVAVSRDSRTRCYSEND